MQELRRIGKGRAACSLDMPFRLSPRAWMARCSGNPSYKFEKIDVYRVQTWTRSHARGTRASVFQFRRTNLCLAKRHTVPVSFEHKIGQHPRHPTVPIHERVNTDEIAHCCSSELCNSLSSFGR